MAVLALAVAGAALAPAGYAAIGWTVGQVVGQLLFPGKLPDQQGPRVGDLRAQQSQYGAAIPILYGTVRVAGNVIWSTPLIETVNTTRVGGKGAPSQTQTTYSYRVSFAVLLGEGPMLGIRRIWADGKLIYDLGASADVLTAMASNALAPGIEFYPGTETQLPDPTMESYLGVGQVPAYRGRAYLVFSDLQLEGFGNRRPNITVEVVATGTIGAQQTYATPPSIPGFTNYDSIATDGDVLIALDYGAPGRTSRSVDGQTWSNLAAVQGSSGNARCIHWANGVWHVLDTNAICWSNDGTSWTAVLAGAGALTGGESMAWNGVRYLAIGPNATWSTSLDGRIWTSQPVPQTKSWIDVCWTGSLFVVLAQDGTIAYSPDGLAWTLASIGTGGSWRSIASSGQHIVAVQSTLATYARSLDAASWLLGTMPASGYNRIRWGGEFYVAVRGGTVDAFARSFDGLTWQSYGQAQAISRSGLVYRNGTWFTVSRDASPNQRVVTLRFDVITPGAVALSSIVSNLCLRAGLQVSDIDVTALTDQVDGYAVGQQISVRGAIEPLQQAFFFDPVESNGLIAFRKRGQAPVAIIAEGDLAAVVAGDDLPDDLTMTRQQEPELPAAVSVVYIDRDSDYMQNTQRSQRSTTLSRQQTGVELAIVMTADRARAIAETLLYDAWTQRQRYQFQTSRAYAALEPADVVTIPRGATTHTVRLERKTESRSGVIAWEAAAEEASVYTQAATGGAGSAGQTTVRAAPATIFAPLDLPMLRDQDDDSAFYAAAAGASAGWRGAVIYRSADGGATYDESGAMTAEAAIGVTVGTLWNNGFHPQTFDEGSLINVELRRGTFSSATELAVLEGANYVMVGSEIIQFKSAVMYAQDFYQLTGLLRGRRGTEWAMTGHAAAGEQVVLLSAATLRRFPSDLGAARLYKPVSIGRTVQATVGQSFTYAGVNRLPFAPVQLGGGRNASNDLTLTWVRRSRQGISLPWNFDPPIGETSELYDVEVWNPAFTVLRRTFSNLTTPTASYNAAQQAADSGGVLSSYGIRVFQRNAVLGRGYALQGTI